jgi:hypothetical protein
MINSFIDISEFKSSVWLTGSPGRNTGAADIKTKACDISELTVTFRVSNPHIQTDGWLSNFQFMSSAAP